MTTWEKNRLPGSALRVEAIGRATRIALALVLFAAAPRAQNLSGALTSGTFSTATNCAATNPPSGCVSATLTQGTNVTIQAAQTVLGPGFDAKASNTSTSLAIEPLPPAVTSVTPASGSGATQNFTVAASSGDWAGAGTVQFLANWTVDATNACYAIYYQSSNSMYLLNDNASQWLGGSAPGTAGATVSNSQCTLNIQNSAASLSGNNLNVTFAVTFNASFIGPQQVFALTSDASGQNSGWQDEGIWTGYPAPSSQPPCTPAASCTVTPTGQTGMSAAFTFTSSDLNGAAYMPQEFLLLGSYSANSCVVLVYHDNNAAYLLSDDASAWNPIPAGGSLSNSQCAISGTSGSNSGNNWSYRLTATFAAGYGGAKPIYMQVWDHGLQTSGLLQVGTWTVGTPESITVATNPPGISITMDGTAYASPQTFSLAAGSQHTISTASPQTAGTGNQYVFSNWSDGQAASHTITIPSAAATYTANFSAVDFTITVTPTANPSVAMAGGAAAKYTVSVSSLNGFAGAVTLAPKLPPGFTSTFDSSTISGGSGQTNWYITAPAGAAGNISASVTGTSSALTHTASGGTLAVQDFSLFLSPAYPSPLTVAAGATGNWTVSAIGINGFAQPIQLNQYFYGSNGTNLPNCTTILGLSSNSLTPGGAAATASTQVGAGAQNNYGCVFLVGGSYGGSAHLLTAFLQITSGGDFTLSPWPQQTVAAGATASFTLTYNPFNGFGGTVGFTASGLPLGAVASFAPLQNGSFGSLMTIPVPAGVLAGTYPLTITGSSPPGCTPPSPGVSGNGCFSHVEYSSLVVQGGQGFSITVNPQRRTVAPGAALQYTVQVTGSGGTTGNVLLTAVNNGGGVSFNNNGSTSAAVAVGGSVTMNVGVSSNAPNGSRAVAITGTLGTAPQHAVAAMDVGFPGEVTEVSGVFGNVNDSVGNMIAGVNQNVLIGGSGFGEGQTEEGGGDIEITALTGGGFTASQGVIASEWRDDLIQIAGLLSFEPGTYQVIVWPSGAEEPAYGTFVVDSPPSPTLPNATSISPTSAPVGQQNMGVTITGTDFSGAGAGTVNGVYFTIAGSQDSLMTFTPTSVTSGQIQGNLSIDPGAAVGGRGIVLTTDAGYVAGTAVGFTVQPNSLTLASVVPSVFAAGAQSVSVILTGSGFGGSPTISVDGYGVTATLDPNAPPPTDAAIYALFNIAPDAATSENVSVVVGTPNVQSFQSSQPPQQKSNPMQVSVPQSTGPRITKISPAYLTIGSQNVQLTIAGTALGQSPTVNLPDGISIINQSSSGNSISLTVNIAYTATVGQNPMSVTSGGAPSNYLDLIADGPGYMVVQSDLIGHCSGCSTTVARLVTYKVTTFRGASPGPIPICELPSDAVSDGAGWDCDQPFPGTNYTMCSMPGTTGADGTFFDNWSNKTDGYTPLGCGIPVRDPWMWAASPTATVTFGLLVGASTNTSITINSFESSPSEPNPIPAGTRIYPDGTTILPDGQKVVFK